MKTCIYMQHKRIDGKLSCQRRNTLIVQPNTIITKNKAKDLNITITSEFVS